MRTSSVKWVRLGDYIEPSDKRNSLLAYGLEYVRGISNAKQIMNTKADVTCDVIHKFYIVAPGEFIYNPRTTRMGDKVGLGYNDTNESLLFSFNNIAFRIKADKRSKILSGYLYLYFNREEFDRYAIKHSWGSATELFTFDEMCNMLIPLPDIKVQQELVDTYNGLKALAEQNEALIEPLSKACEAFIVDCKSKYPEVELGGYIEPCDERNSEGKYTLDDVRGISIQKKLIFTKADMQDVSLTPYKLLKPREFSYVTVTSRNGGKISLALNDTTDTYIVSSSYENFRCKDTQTLLSEYLFLLLSRSEFDRYSRFNSWGSARETFDWSELCRVKIPLPKIEVQRLIVNVYKCLEEAKKIASEAREKLKTLCPALVQRAANS